MFIVEIKCYKSVKFVIIKKERMEVYIKKVKILYFLEMIFIVVLMGFWMCFVYYFLVKEFVLKIEGESYIYLYWLRCIKSVSCLDLRNLKDGFLYIYEYVEIIKKYVFLRLVGMWLLEVMVSKKMYLILSVIEIKSVEKILFFLN